MRHLQIVGMAKARKVIRLARFCAWGNHWMSAEDFAAHSTGAPTTHGLCDGCAAELDAEIDRMPPHGNGGNVA